MWACQDKVGKEKLVILNICMLSNNHRFFMCTPGTQDTHVIGRFGEPVVLRLFTRGGADGVKVQSI